MALPKNKTMPKRNRPKQPFQNEGRPPGQGGGRKQPFQNEGRPLDNGRPPRNHPGPKRNGNGNRNGKNKGPGGMRLGAVGNYPGVSRRYVNRLVNGLIRGETRDLRRDKQAVRRESEYLTNQANAQYERGLGDLNYVHGETADYLGALTQQNQQMYGQQAATQQAAGQQLQADISGAFGGAQQATMDEMARLGISGGANMSGLIADQAFQQAQGAQGSADAAANMNMASGNAMALNNAIGGMNQGSMTSNMGLNLNKRNDALAGITQDRMSQLADVNGAIQDAKKGRKDVFMQLMQQLQQTGWDQYVQSQQLNMQQQQHRKSMNKGKKHKGKKDNDKKKRHPAKHGGL